MEQREGGRVEGEEEWGEDEGEDEKEEGGVEEGEGCEWLEVEILRDVG